jgi:hypothetical protein
MASTEPTMSKQGAAGTIRDITLTIPETLEIIRKPASATSQSHITAPSDNGFLTNYGINTRKKLRVRNYASSGTV